MNVHACFEFGLLAKSGVFIPATSGSAVTRQLHTPPFPLPAHPTVPSLSLSFFLFSSPPNGLSPHGISIMATKQEVTSDTVDDGPPISVPDSGETGESGKLKMIVQLVRKCMGIKDIASM